MRKKSKKQDQNEARKVVSHLEKLKNEIAFLRDQLDYKDAKIEQTKADRVVLAELYDRGVIDMDGKINAQEDD